MDFIFTVSLFFVFAASALAVVLLSLQAYQSVTGRSESNYNLRTGAAYISQKIKHSDSRGAVEISEIDGIPALTLSQEFNDSQYITYIYSYDGSLMELFAPKNAQLSVQSGTPILPMEDFNAQLTDDGLLRFTLVTPDGESHVVDITSRT